MVLFGGCCHFKYTAVEFNNTASMLDGASDGTGRQREYFFAHEYYRSNMAHLQTTRNTYRIYLYIHLPSSIVFERFEFDGRPSTVL